MSDLVSKKCILCEGNIPKFNIDEIHKYLKKVDGWDVKEDQSSSFF
jgi:4a-hydroxytetrahydrobiopterin dehydratase